MSLEKPMPVLLIEDNEYEVENFKNYLNQRNDVNLIKTTALSYEGIEFTKAYMPEGIILDLELHNGEGSGLNFLEEIAKLKLDFKPLIVVTTNVSSEIIYNRIRELGVDFIFYKKQKDYNPEIVINSMISLRPILYTNKESINTTKDTTETAMEREQRIKDKINNELDLIGIANHLKGRDYLFDAIYYLLTNDEDGDSVFYYLANKYKIGNSSVSRAMQTAINHAWRMSPVEDLLVHYKARINIETGVPSPTEFVYYYKEKIKKLL